MKRSALPLVRLGLRKDRRDRFGKALQAATMAISTSSTARLFSSFIALSQAPSVCSITSDRSYCRQGTSLSCRPTAGSAGSGNTARPRG